MKRTTAFLSVLSLLITIHTTTVSAQPVKQSTTDSAFAWIQQHETPIHTGSYEQFTSSMKPMLKMIGEQEVVGLGEGTHGTSEFQTIRDYTSRYLCTEKGFSVICLENSYGWCTELNNYVQTGQGNLDTLMKYNLLGMWQNTEIKDLLQWMKEYNQSHRNKLQIAGMDYSESSTTARLIKQLTDKWNRPVLGAITDTLVKRAAFMDAVYSDFNNPKPVYKWKDFLDNGVKTYEFTRQVKAMVDSMKQELASHLSTTETKTLYTALFNFEQAFYSIYKPVKEKEDVSRDEIMANMVKRIREDHAGAKVIVWAHNAHLAKGKIFDDNNGGGTGSFIESFYPGKYYVLGTGTAEGTFSATTDRFIVNTSAFKTYPLNKAKGGTWEQVINRTGKGTVFIDTRDKEYPSPLLPLRFTGYSAAQRGDFVDSRLNKLFDGFIFIPSTQATHIQQ